MKLQIMTSNAVAYFCDFDTISKIYKSTTLQSETPM